MFAPRTPNADRQYTGNGMPYFVPACALRIIGMSTMALPKKIVSTASYQFIPSEISEEASMYVGMHADLEIHNAAMSSRPPLRSCTRVGAISSFQYGEWEMSSVTSWMPLVTRTPSIWEAVELMGQGSNSVISLY